jgi:FkbM family methyltransferase
MLYRLSRFSALHNAMRKTAYAVLWRTPDSIKYGIGGVWRRMRRPYRLLSPGDTAIQIGAPWDTLRAGRSRAAHFARFVGHSGKVIVIEPAHDNIVALRLFASRHGLANMTIVPKGAWSKSTRLRFLINPEHPASNLVEEVIDPAERDRNAYVVTEVDVESVDSIVSGLNVGPIRLMSVTTNGSDPQIFEGASNTLAKTEFVAVVTRECESQLMRHGFRLVGHDDRGYTYGRSQAP